MHFYYSKLHLYETAAASRIGREHKGNCISLSKCGVFELYIYIYERLYARIAFRFQRALRLTAAFRTRTRTNSNPNDTVANAAGRRGVRVCNANGTCENQGAWVAKSFTKSEDSDVPGIV
jgi:hypothetical protein